ncbi:tudor domain-containing protein 5 [Elysia marginata]|uniref:Tudor domain-containing protein 5 n=1 Tax=Elysia marginata TaxID=1093978 RepID=A0AAV4ENJ6_9GAST|nr:tudor domain-containing protein 5 [Elysia marginata]
MTDLAKRKEEAKKEIRSLLLSAPLGLTIIELKRDFAEFIGHPLPWKELGYSSAEDFVQDIPDTVKITWSNTGMVLTGVANSSTKHIEKLVQSQKVDSKLKKKVMDRRSRQSSRPLLPPDRAGGNTGWGQRRPLMRPPRFVNNMGYLHQMHNNNFPPPVQYQQPGYHRQRARHMAPPPSVPAYTRGQISQLVAQHKQGLPLTHFCSIFRNRYGVPLDYREMGFSTEQDLLASLRDIVGLRQLAGGETRVMSLEACVAWDLAKWRGDSENISRHQQVDARSVNNNRKPLLPPTGHAVTEPKPLLPSNNTYVQCEGLSRGKGRGRGALRKEPTRPTSASQTSNENQNSHVTHKEEQVSPLRSTTPDLDEHCNIPTHVQNEIRQIMMKRPKGVCASRLQFEYKDMFKKALPTKTYGYNSVIEFVSDLPHIIRVDRPFPQGDWFLFPVPAADGSEENLRSSLVKVKISSASSAMSTSTTTTPSPPPLEVDKALKEAVAQVMSINSEGIPLDKFQETFQAVTGKQLNVARYGPGGLKRILHGMSDILIISLDASDKAIVLPKMHNTPRRFDHLQDQFQPVALGDSTSDPLMHLPNDAVSPGCKYRPQPLPAPNADGEGYIELYVSNVISPDMFWIQLRGRKTTLALEDLMDELEAVYSSKSLPKEYHMTRQLAQKGMLCAVIFPEDSFWHRGFILGLKDQLYQVYYVDYGNTCYVSIDQMRLLKSKFLRLPAQAIQARLGHIKPKGGVWKTNATQRMLALAREKPLVGLVVAEKDRVLSLCLTDTSKDEDIHFNDMFVDEGYAVFEPENSGVQVPVHEQHNVQLPPHSPWRQDILVGEGAI